MKAIGRISLAVLLVLTFALRAGSQEEERPVASAVVINGRLHPELIPDSVAYRTVFTQLSGCIGDPESEHLRFGKVGLSPDDTESLYRIIKSFKNDLEVISKTYMDAVEEAKKNNDRVDPSLLENFRASRSQLVRSTRRDLETGLSSEGVAHFHKYMEVQKAQMTVTLDD